MSTGMIIAVIIVLLVLFVFIKYKNAFLGEEKVIVKEKERTPFALVSKDDKSMRLVTTVEFSNIGTRSAAVLDMLARPQLAFEQYDGIDARCKVEAKGTPREDDYFEAALIERHENLFINVYVDLTARKGASLNDALAHMVDFSIDLIYEVTGRQPCHYAKTRIWLTAGEMAKLAGAKLIAD